jgi:hypothetical protein
MTNAEGLLGREQPPRTSNQCLRGVFRVVVARIDDNLAAAQRVGQSRPGSQIDWVGCAATAEGSYVMSA